MPYKNIEDKNKYNKKYAKSHKKEKQLYDLKRRLSKGQMKTFIKIKINKSGGIYFWIHFWSRTFNIFNFFLSSI